MAVYIKAFYDWVEQTEALSDAERGRLFVAMLEYARSGEMPDMEGNERFLFPVFKAQIDREEAVSAVKAKNAAKAASAEKAKQGEQEDTTGSNPKQTEQTEANQNKSKQKAAKRSNKEKEKEEEKENDKEKDSLPPPATQCSPTGGTGTQEQKEEPEGFALFWELYPRKEARSQALKAWRKLNPSLDLEADILAHVQKRRESWEWTKDGGNFVPYASRFLEQHRWEDEFSTAPPAVPRPYGKKAESCSFTDLVREELCYES